MNELRQSTPQRTQHGGAAKILDFSPAPRGIESSIGSRTSFGLKKGIENSKAQLHADM
jgi:hypothetical protein